MMNFEVVVLDSEAEISSKIAHEIRSHVYRAVAQSFPSIRTRTKQWIREAIQAAPEYQSLLNGQLQVDFGLVTPDIALESIINSIANRLDIDEDIVMTSKGFAGGITLQFLSDDMSDVTSNEYWGGTQIPWLTWLMHAGDAVVVANYHIVYDPPNASTSRTGEAIMIPGGNYRVPPQFSGTTTNNWVTRAFDAAMSDLDRIVEEEISRRI